MNLLQAIRKLRQQPRLSFQLKPRHAREGGNPAKYTSRKAYKTLALSRYA